MEQIQGQLVKINNIAGMLYANPKRESSRIIIYGIGAPALPDNGKLADAEKLLHFDTDIFVPDYIGFGRSDGIFTPQNCVNTFLQLFSNFKNGCVGKSGYKNLSLKLQYDDIHFIGRSFGGMYITLLPKLNKEINNLCLVFPILDYVACGNIPGEEKVEGFMKAMKNDGYKHLYRGIENKVWEKHFSNQDNLYPFTNTKYLKDAKIFIGHGKKDTNINFSHSQRYFDQIIRQFPSKKDDSTLKLYHNGAHNDKTSGKIVTDYMRWQHIKEIQ